MLNIFELFCVWEIVESWLIYANKFSWITQLYFLTEITKQSCTSFFFLPFRLLIKKKNVKFTKCYFLHAYNLSISKRNKLIKLFFLQCSCKKLSWYQHCKKSVRIQSFSDLNFGFGLNTPYLSIFRPNTGQNYSKYGYFFMQCKSW